MAAPALKLIIVLCICLYLVLIAFMYFQQRKLQYFPNRIEITPQQVGLIDVQRVVLQTPDGEKILAWYHLAPKNRPTLLYFHGNAGGLSGRADKLRFYQSNGFGFLAVSYRGYEGSTGSPTESGFLIDAKSSYDWLISQNVRHEKIGILGESIGTGVAVQLASQNPVQALALEAPYFNAVDVGAKIYWYLPVRLLMKYQFRSSEYIANFHGPLLIMHGKEDQIIPCEQGQKLFERANQPKQLITVNGKGHEMIFDPETWAAEITFFNANIPAAQ
jgi:uncharacterized protein